MDPRIDRALLNPTLVQWQFVLHTYGSELSPTGVLKQVIRKSDDIYSPTYAAYRAVNAATNGCWDRLDRLAGVTANPFHAAIGLNEAATILEESWSRLNPVPSRVSQNRIVSFDDLVRGLKYGRLAPFRDPPVPEGLPHQNLQARAMGIVQRFGLIYPYAVCCGAGRANFDFAFRTRNDKLGIAEVMTGGWPFKPKRDAAGNAVEDGIIPILIGNRPPWELEDRFRRPHALLWGEHGVHTATGSAVSETRIDLTPPIKGIHYLPVPEICDASGRLAMGIILGIE